MEHRGPAVGDQLGRSIEELGPGQQQDEAREGAGRQQVLEEEHQPLVGVLRVVDHHHDRLGPVAHPLEERRPRGEQVLARRTAGGPPAPSSAASRGASQSRSSASATYAARPRSTSSAVSTAHRVPSPASSRLRTASATA